MPSQFIAAQTGLNRLGEKRLDAAFIAAALQSPTAKVLLFVDFSVPIFAADAEKPAHLRWFSPADVLTRSPDAEFFFLGQDQDGAYVFVSQVTAHDLAAEVEALQPIVDVRSLALQGALSHHELLIAAQARGLMVWADANRHCGRCGGKLIGRDGGWRRQCQACHHDVYPRTDPVVIMLITYEDKCLLGSEHRFPEALYTTLAGFMEAGDDIEHAVRREVMEEAGLPVGDVRYVMSQPWPFPHSLMIGCWGKALSGEINLESKELRDARWFTREDVNSMLEGRHGEGLYAPPKISMTYVLLRKFVDGELPDA